MVGRNRDVLRLPAHEVFREQPHHARVRGIHVLEGVVEPGDREALPEGIHELDREVALEPQVLDGLWPVNRVEQPT